MSSGMPELGSKISLISKADIRYEGRLFTVDPQECTIALANVRSFGTEDRESQFPIAPQSQIYDYILFRGTDIKDIRVVNNGMPHPNDPAIMQMQLPNGQHFMPHMPMPTMNPPMASSVIDLLAGASRSTTPQSLISRKSPSADMAVQVNQHNNAGHNRDAGHKRQNQQQRSGSGGHAGGNNYNNRDRRNSGHMEGQQFDNRNHYNNQRNNQNRNNQGGWVNRGNQQNHANNNNNMRNNRGRGRMPNQPGGYRQPPPMTGNNPKQGGRPKNAIKFESDFDFEQANNKFEELRSQLAKLKVGEEPKTEPQVTTEADKKDDSGNETGAGEHEQEEEDVAVCYDKTKSFFDNISCEAAQDRSKNKKNDWRQERKLNHETFGISSTRRGNFRGRGNYYNRNMNNYGGGSYNRGYRPQHGYNNRNRNYNNRIGQSTGLPNNGKSHQQQPNQQNNQQQQQTQPEPTQKTQTSQVPQKMPSSETTQESQPQPVAVAAGK